MSKQLINEYRAELDRLRAVSGSRRESVLREAFKDLLKRWGRAQDLHFVPEHDIVTAQKNRIYLDGALLHSLRVPFGYWEAKDADDDLDAEIAAKSRKGYPRDNIVFSDDHTAVLIQDGAEAARVPMDDTDALYGLLQRFFAHERQEIADFNKAVRQFAADLPAVLAALRDIIAEKRAASQAFADAEAAFLQHARDAINPAVGEDDVQEMLIQHILTEDIFAKVFDNPDFHESNNVARELKKLEGVLFGYGEKQRLLRALQPYYAGISRTAAVIGSHSEKQGFLKGLYENFYKVYNAKAADRLGVVYTPGEIVRFMIRSADWLCEKHFGRNLVDRGVEILDPATGTGTFIVELLEHFRGHHDKLRHKYKEELHANEVAILPYYVANLNIEATYQAITGQFAEFENLCFVDTLDNVDALGIHSGHQFDLLGTLSDENIERIKRQNRRKISVIIGNPPYNANQQNENDNNKNRAYAHIDRRIKDTYIKASTAQKTKLYDMYVRFLRWASDRLGDEGILAFITNRSFVDARMADGLRAGLSEEFAEGWIVDLGGDYKKKGSGGSGNVFGIGTGVAISLWVKSKDVEKRTAINYISAPPGTGDDKLLWLSGMRHPTNNWQRLPDRVDAAWLYVPKETTEGLLSMADPATKQQAGAGKDRSIFKIYSLGIATNRDEWVYDRKRSALSSKIQYLISVYDQTNSDSDEHGTEIKWSRNLKRRLKQDRREEYDMKREDQAYYRPFNLVWMYQSTLFNDELGSAGAMFLLPYNADRSLNGAKNASIIIMGDSTDKPFFVLSVDKVVDLNFVSPASGGSVTFTRYRYTKSGERVDNITDWALARFREHYGTPLPLGEEGARSPRASGKVRVSGRPNDVRHPHPSAADAAPSLSHGEREKDAIFHYVYAVLHDPVYRETYALNLKREFPRIPFHPDFARWAAWGEALMAMHIGYEDVEPWPVERVDLPAKRAAGTHPKPILRSHPEQGLVVVDAETQLTGIPPKAWTYRLGNRSAIDWVLDQHKEKRPRDPTIAAKFDTYRFADHKEAMIALLAKVARVSVDTVAITEAMRGVERV